MPFLTFFSGSFAVLVSFAVQFGDHLRFWDHLWCWDHLRTRKVHTFTLYSPKAINHLGNVLHSCTGLCISGLPYSICIDQCIPSCTRSESAHNKILALVAELSTLASIHFLLFSSPILVDLEFVVQQSKHFPTHVRPDKQYALGAAKGQLELAECF